MTNNLRELAELTLRSHAPSIIEGFVRRNPLLAYLDTQPPPTRWQTFIWPIKRRLIRVRDAWDVLLGRKEAVDENW